MEVLNFRSSKSNRVEEIEFRGDKHLKVPAVLLTEGILEYPGKENTNQFVPQEELANSRFKWNGTAVSIDHPSMRGTNVSANEPEVFEDHVVGHVFNTHVENGKLKSDLYLNKELLSDHPEGQDILEHVNEGGVVEVSTAYRDTLIEENGTHNGEEFDAIQTNIVPDHLAVLPIGTKGRCSKEDGCGAPRVNKKEMVETIEKNRLEEPKMPDYEGTQETSWDGLDLEDIVEGFGWEEVNSVSDMSQEQKEKAASLTFMGDSSANNFEDLVSFEVVDPDSMELNKEALESVKQLAGNLDEEAQEQIVSMANELLEEEFNVTIEDNEMDKLEVIQEFIEDSEKEDIADIAANEFEVDKQEVLDLMENKRDNKDEDKDMKDKENQKQNDCGDCDEEKTQNEEENKTETEESSMFEEILEENGIENEDDLKKVLETANEVFNAVEAKKENLVDELAEKTNFNAEELQDKSLDHLEKIKDNIVDSNNANYSLQNAPKGDNEEEEKRNKKSGDVINKPDYLEDKE